MSLKKERAEEPLETKRPSDIAPVNHIIKLS